MIVFLLSKSEFAFKILSGEKRYEFRRVMFRRRDIDKVVVYATAPYSKIIGYFTAGRVSQGSPKILWNKFNKYGGIDKKSFFLYFKNRFGIAIEIKNPVSFRRHRKPREILPNFALPNSFRYLTENEFELIKKASA